MDLCGFSVSAAWFLRLFRHRATPAAAAALLILVFSASQFLHAQSAASIQFLTPVQLVTPPTATPYGVAVDSAGNTFVSDYENGRVLEVPAGCGDVTCEVVLPTVGLAGPTGLAVDSNDDVFIADYNNNRVVEIPWTGSGFGTQITLPSTGQDFPSGVAVDAAGDVFIANDDYLGKTPNLVVELPWNGSSYGAPVTVANWLPGPFGLALDALGNLFVADFSGGQIVELPKGCSSSTCQVTLATGVSEPTAVSVDTSGNVFFASWGGNQVVEVPSGCATSSCWIQLGSGLSSPAGVAADAGGNIYIGDFGNKRLLDVRQNSFDFGTVSVGASATASALINFNSAVTLNTTTPYTVVTQGATGLDFSDGGSGTCSAAAYSAGQSCLINLKFTPQLAGSAQGALRLVDASGNTVATGYLSGTGSAPQITFRPGTRSSIGSGLLSTDGVAIDRQGNIFVADSASGTVQELLAPSYTTTQVLGGSFVFTDPVGVAVDGAGNLFVADRGAASIEEIEAPAYTAVNAIGSGFSSPSGVAVDSRGNVYVADTGNNAVKEIVEAGGYSSVKTLATGLGAPTGVAVDSAGNVFVADTGNNALKEIVAVDGVIPSSPALKTLGSAFSAPGGVAVDDFGNVYVADTGNDAVDEISATGGYSAVDQLAAGFGNPSGVAVDGYGNVYVGTSVSTQVVRLDYADPPTLNFEAGVGSTSSPQTATIINSGNADLTFAAPASGYNPSVSADFTIQTNESTGTACPLLIPSSGSAALSAGAMCLDQLTFSSATAGVVTGSLVMTDNNLNSAGSKQTITLNGLAVLLTVAPASLSTAQVGSPYNQTLTASGGTSPYTYQVTSGALPAGINLSSSGVLSGTPTAAGSFTFNVTVTDADNLTGTQSYTLSVSAPTLTLTPSTLPAGQVGLAYSQALNAGGGTSPYSYKVTSGSLPGGLTLSSGGLLSGTPTASGSFTFAVTATDSSTGTGAPFSASNSYSLTVNAPVISIAPASLPSGQTGIAYTQVSLTASGGAAPYSYGVTSGALPPGLSLSKAGLLSGTPTAGGTFSFTVTATDAGNSTGTQAYTISVAAPAIAVTPASLPAGQVNVAYNETLVVSGGTSPYTFALKGSLPAGITFDAATATLSGTPTAGGSFPISITVTDSSTGGGPYTATVNYTLVVNPGTAVLTFAAVPPQTYGNPPFTISATSSSTGAITYSIVSGPAAIDPATGMVTLTGAGELTVEASQAATASYTSAVAQTLLNIAKQTSVIKLSASTMTASTGQSVTLTATVAAAVTGTPTGTVSFFDGSTQIGTAVPLSGGTAQLSVSNLNSGQNVISAVYSGDSNFLTSNVSLGSAIVISTADFSFTATGVENQSVMPGGTATFEFSLAPTAGNYPDAVTFSVSGLPPGAVATPSMSSVPSTAGPQTITITIKASSGNSAYNAAPKPGRGSSPFTLALLLPFLGLSGFAFKRRKLLKALRLAVFLAIGTMAVWQLSGCASVSGVLGHSYSVGVTASSGSVQHTAFVNMTVK